MLKNNYKKDIFPEKDAQIIKKEVQFIKIDNENAQQRIDNFLTNFLNNVPKSMIYRLLRKGEIRVNKKRIKPLYKLQNGDEIRIAPLYIEQKPQPKIPTKLNKISSLEQNIIFEDDSLIVINKPFALAVHGGSGLSYGLIEALRALRPEARYLELVHRLDRQTSGLLLIAKKRSALRELHAQLRLKTMQKNYVALVYGQWQAKIKKIHAPLLAYTQANGERMVKVNDDGKESLTRFKVLERFNYLGQDLTLIQASPVTGRTHQIRVHCKFNGNFILGDEKYGDDEINQSYKNIGLERLFLHAKHLSFTHPKTQERVEFDAPLEPSLEKILLNLRKNNI